MSSPVLNIIIKVSVRSSRSSVYLCLNGSKRGLVPEVKTFTLSALTPRSVIFKFADIGIPSPSRIKSVRSSGPPVSTNFLSSLVQSAPFLLFNFLIL